MCKRACSPGSPFSAGNTKVGGRKKSSTTAVETNHAQGFAKACSVALFQTKINIYIYIIYVNNMQIRWRYREATEFRGNKEVAPCRWQSARGGWWDPATHLLPPSSSYLCLQYRCMLALARNPIEPNWFVGTRVLDVPLQSTPSVVYINTFVNQRDAFSMNVLEVPAGTGSGFVWDDKGHVVTNFHVIR